MLAEAGRVSGRMSTKPRSTSAARKPIRNGGQYTKNTSPMMFSLGTAPHSRESQDCTRLSPMKKYRPSGILRGPCVFESRRNSADVGSRAACR